MRNDLTFLAERGLGKLEDVDATVARVSTTQDMAEAAADADFVLECVAEDMALKQDTFQKLDADVQARRDPGDQHLGHEPHRDRQHVRSSGTASWAPTGGTRRSSSRWSRSCRPKRRPPG